MQKTEVGHSRILRIQTKSGLVFYEKVSEQTLRQAEKLVQSENISLDEALRKVSAKEGSPPKKQP